MSTDGESPWLADPKVQLFGPVARRFTFVTDGEESRLKEKSVPEIGGGGLKGGAAWPASEDQWLMPLPIDLGPGQSLITDSEVGWVKEKSVPTMRPMDEGSRAARVRTTTSTTTTTTTTSTTTSTTTTTTTQPPTTTTSTTTSSTTTTQPPTTTTTQPPP